jgi:hypothetical protein
MSKIPKLQCSISQTELLELYGYEPWEGTDIAHRWRQLTEPWHPSYGYEIGCMRQQMLTIHKELFPDDERWNL